MRSKLQIAAVLVAISAASGLSSQLAAQGGGAPAPGAQQAGTQDAESARLVAGVMFMQQASEIVSKREQNEQLRNVAAQITDYAQRLRAAFDAAALSAAGTQFGEVGLTEQQRQEINQLARISQDHLGTRYVQAMIGELQTQQESFRAYMRSGAQQRYRDLADQNLPESEKILAMLQKIEGTRR